MQVHPETRKNYQVVPSPQKKSNFQAQAGSCFREGTIIRQIGGRYPPNLFLMVYSDPHITEYFNLLYTQKQLFFLFSSLHTNRLAVV